MSRLMAMKRWAGLRFASDQSPSGTKQIVRAGYSPFSMDPITPDELIKRYGTAAKFDQALADSQAYWSQKLATLKFHTL